MKNETNRPKVHFIMWIKYPVFLLWQSQLICILSSMDSTQKNACGLLRQIRCWRGNAIEKYERFYYRSYLFVLSKWTFFAFRDFWLLQALSVCSDRCRTSVWDNSCSKTMILFFYLTAHRNMLVKFSFREKTNYTLTNKAQDSFQSAINMQEGTTHAGFVWQYWCW